MFLVMVGFGVSVFERVEFFFSFIYRVVFFVVKIEYIYEIKLDYIYDYL